MCSALINTCGSEIKNKTVNCKEYWVKHRMAILMERYQNRLPNIAYHVTCHQQCLQSFDLSTKSNFLQAVSLAT